MKDEIASFKVTAADIQKQSVHPSGDRHTQEMWPFYIYIYIYNMYKITGGCICTVY